MPFDQYLALDGFSHSFLKGQRNGISPYFKVTDKIKLGSLVDALLTQDNRFDFSDPLASKAMIIAGTIKSTFAGMISNFKPQISYTSNMQLDGFNLPVKGRLDWELPNFATIDLKLTAAKNDRDFVAYINHMGYKNQLWHYSKMAGLNKGYIIPFSTTENKCLSIVGIPIGETNEFWESKIKEFGTV